MAGVPQGQAGGWRPAAATYHPLVSGAPPGHPMVVAGVQPRLPTVMPAGAPPARMMAPQGQPGMMAGAPQGQLGMMAGASPARVMAGVPQGQPGMMAGAPLVQAGGQGESGSPQRHPAACGGPVPLWPRAATQGVKVFLVNHGSFNPVHRGHIHMMVAAKRCLEDNGYEVVAGYMGTTDPSWIHQKGYKCLDTHVRVRCIDALAAGEGQSWILGEARGVTVGGSCQLIPILQKQHPGVVGFNVLGGDLATKYQPLPCVVIGRTGEPLPREERTSTPTFVVAVDEETGDFSSTKVRKALADHDVAELDRLMRPEVKDVMLAMGDAAWT